MNSRKDIYHKMCYNIKTQPRDGPIGGLISRDRNIPLPSSLKKLKKDLYKAFRKSSGVNLYGGPSGIPIAVGQEVWNVGLGPGWNYFASNGISGHPSELFRSYSISKDKELLKYEGGRFMGGGWIVDPNGYVAVDSVEEVKWLIGLVAVTIGIRGWRDDLCYNIPFPSE